MSTKLTYNGVIMQNVLTRTFEQTPEYDPSGADLLFHRFHVVVRGYVHKYLSPVTGMLISPGSVTSVAEAEIAIRKLLSEPRRQFKMTIGNKTLLYVKGAFDPYSPQTANQAAVAPNQISGSGESGDSWLADLDNGPKPQSVSISNVVGSELLVVEFSIKLAVLECDAATRNITGVLSNRWTVRDVIDESWLTTRTYNGRLRVTNPQVNPHSFRGWVVPPLQLGFKRQNIDVATTANGLELEYTIVDKEEFAAPPDPAIKWSGTHMAISDDGVSVNEEFQVSVWGSKYTPKINLVRLAAVIAQQHLGLNDPKNNQTIEQASLISYLDENRVEMRLRTLKGGVNAAKDGQLAFPTERLVSMKTGVKNYKPDVHPVPNNYGTATLTGLFVSYLQSPCSPEHGMTRATDPPPKKESNSKKGSGTTVTVREGEAESAKDIAARFRADQTKYVFYEISTKIVTQSQTVQVPVASTQYLNTTRRSARFVSLAPPMQYREITVTAERYNQWPSMPDGRDIITGTRQIRLIGKTEIEAHSTYTADKKTRKYSLRVTYKHGLSSPYSKTELIRLGKQPWEMLSLDQTALNQEAAFDSRLSF